MLSVYSALSCCILSWKCGAPLAFSKEKEMSVAENCTWPVKSTHSSQHSSFSLILQGLVKDGTGTFEGGTLQWLREGLSLLENCTILLLTFGRFHFKC